MLFLGVFPDYGHIKPASQPCSAQPFGIILTPFVRFLYLQTVRRSHIIYYVFKCTHATFHCLVTGVNTYAGLNDIGESYPVSSIYISGVRTIIHLAFRKVKPKIAEVKKNI